MSSDLAILQNQFDPLVPRLAAALGKMMPAEQLIQSVVLSVERNPKLLSVDRQSLFNAAMTAAVLGLPVDNVTGQGFIIPFNVKGRGPVAQFMTGYKGLSTLAARSSFSVRGDVVRQRDEFSIDKPRGIVEHRITWSGDRGDIVGAWALAASNHLPPIAEFVTIEELLELRSRAKSTQGDTFSPWLDSRVGWPAMCAKTAKRRLGRSIPFGALPQYGIAVAIEESTDERGLPAWTSPEGGVQVGSQGRSEPSTPHSDDQPAINITPGGSEWPNLTPDLARRASLLAESVSTATSTRQLEARWNHAKAGPLKDQIRTMSASSLDKLTQMHDKKFIQLSDIEESANLAE